MKKVCYLLDNTPEAMNACEKVFQSIPCFGSINCTEGTIEVSVECLECNIPFVEKVLAPYV